MRKLIVTILMSLDGHYEGPGGNFMAMPLDDEFDTHNHAELAEAGTLLLGARTFQLFQGFWPQMAGDPAATEVHRAISRRNGEIEKVVVSDTPAEEQDGPYRDTTTFVRRADAHEYIAGLKRGEGAPILMFGSRVLWNDLLAAGLVDEFHIVLGAGVLGGGTPAFDGKTTARLRLLGSETHEGSENIVLRYAVEKQG